MKANEFVKVFGLKLAKRDVAALASGFIRREDFLEHYGFDILNDLKRIVESHEYIESYGGLNESKRTFEMRHGVINLDGWDKLKQAIADVESCQ